MLFLPLLALAAATFGDRVAGIYGLVWSAGRLLTIVTYAKGLAAARRGFCCRRGCRRGCWWRWWWGAWWGEWGLERFNRNLSPETYLHCHTVTNKMILLTKKAVLYKEKCEENCDVAEYQA